MSSSPSVTNVGISPALDTGCSPTANVNRSWADGDLSQSPLLTPAQRERPSVELPSNLTPESGTINESASSNDVLVTNAEKQSVSATLEDCSQLTSQNSDKSVPDGQNHSMNSSSNERVDSGSSDIKTLAPLHISDIKRSKRLSHILNTLKNLPIFRTTVIIGDSNMHGINDGELDIANRSCAVRSFSGLCVVAAVYAFKRHKYSYDHIRRVIFSLGTNDFLHRQQHCGEDWKVHLSNLFTEARRIFPNASIGFIKPFTGLPTVPNDYIKFLDDCLREVDPRVKRYSPLL